MGAVQSDENVLSAGNSEDSRQRLRTIITDVLALQGAVCGKAARTDLWGVRGVIPVPTRQLGFELKSWNQTVILGESASADSPKLVYEQNHYISPLSASSFIHFLNVECDTPSLQPAWRMLMLLHSKKIDILENHLETRRYWCKIKRVGSRHTDCLLLPSLRKIIAIPLPQMLLLNAEGVDGKPLKMLDK